MRPGQAAPEFGITVRDEGATEGTASMRPGQAAPEFDVKSGKLVAA